MSRGAFKSRYIEYDDSAYYDGYKAAVFEDLPVGIAYGEGQETYRYLSNI